jgi:hypothetical protein
MVLLLMILPFFTGCYGVSSYFSSVRSDIVRNAGGNFTTDTEFAIGPTMISLAGMFISSEDDPGAKKILKGISGIQISVQKRITAFEKGSNYRILQNIDRRMNKFGWRYIIKTCSKDDISAIYVNRDLENGIKQIFIVSLDKNELVLIQLDGNLKDVFETAIQERGLNYSYSTK